MKSVYKSAGLRYGCDMKYTDFKHVFASDEYVKTLRKATLELNGNYCLVWDEQYVIETIDSGGKFSPLLVIYLQYLKVLLALDDFAVVVCLFCLMCVCLCVCFCLVFDQVTIIIRCFCYSVDNVMSYVMFWQQITHVTLSVGTNDVMTNHNFRWNIDKLWRL